MRSVALVRGGEITHDSCAELVGIMSRAKRNQPTGAVSLVSNVIVVVGISIWERRRAGVVTPGKAS